MLMLQKWWRRGFGPTNPRTESSIVSSEDEPTDVLLDISKYEGHTPAPWRIVSPTTNVTREHRHENEGKAGLAMSEWSSYGVAQVGPCSVRRYMKDSEPKETWHANIHLIADAPLLLEEVKRCHDLIEKMQHSIVKNIGDCWVCDMPIDSCDARTCERQMLEDIELGTAST